MKKNSAGITLVEVVVASFVTTIIITILVLLITTFFDQYQLSFDENIATATAERAVRQITAHVRETRPADNGAYPLVTTDDQTFTFYADFDNDGDAEQIRYFLDQTEIKQGIIEPTGIPAQYPSSTEVTRTIADDVRNGSNPVFYYYNGDWPGDTQNNPLPPASRLLETRLVQVSVRIDTDPNHEPSAFDLSSSIQLRNLKTNL